MSFFFRSLPFGIARRPGWVVVACLGLAALALVPATRLQLLTRLEALLPGGSPAAEGYRLFLEHFGGFEKVFVLISADGETAEPPRALLTRAARQLASALAESEEVRHARTGLGAEDQAFFFEQVLPRAPLLAGSPSDENEDDAWRRGVAARLTPEAVEARVAQIRRLAGTLQGMAVAPLWRRDPLGFAEDLPALGAPGGGAGGIDPLSPAWLSPDGRAALVVVSPARSEMDPEGGRILEGVLAAAYETIRQAEPEGASLRFAAVGGPLYAAQDERLLRRDLEATMAGSVLGCGLVLLLAFGGPRVPLAAVLSLLCGLAWTAGILAFAAPERTAVSLGFAAVLIGLGLDYAIHAGARYQQLRRDEDDSASNSTRRAEALAATLRQTGPGIATSALTTAAAFAVLALAHFRPLQELGQLVAVGILAILLASVTAGAALLVVPSRRRPRPPGLVWRALGGGVEGTVAFAGRRPREVLAVALVVTAAATWGAFRLELDADLDALRPANHPALAAERQLVERFELGLDTVTTVVPGEDLDAALDAAAAVRRELAAGLGEAGGSLSSPSDWLLSTERRQRRLAALGALPLAAAIEDFEAGLVAAGLDPAAFAQGLSSLRALARGEDPGPVPPAAWPFWLDELVRQEVASAAPGTPGAWAALRLRLPAGSWPEGPPPAVLERLAVVAPGSAVASAPALGREMRSLAGRDLVRLGGVALAVVAAVVWLSFRGRPRPAVLALVPVVLGSLWTLGLWGLAGGHLDLISLTVLPILLGIGVDDGLHAVHGAPLERADPSVLAVSVREAGRAMALTTLTTVVGFGSLLLSQVPGLRRGGLLVAVGVLACLAATLLVLPALEALRRRADGATAGGRAA